MKESKQVKCEFRDTFKSHPKSRSVRKSRKVFRNLSRRYRRRRSRLRYYKQLMFKRKTDDLCTAVTVCDIADMEWTPSTSTEVSEWQKQDQTAYWKSRALSLEYENRMLIHHLRNVYAKQTEDYANHMRNHERQNEEIEPEIGERKIVQAIEPGAKKRKQEMEKLYGQMAPRIMGMETAVQLNYDLHMDEGKIPFWPHTPLNLKFD